MNQKPKNKVIIIAGDHHNPLNLVRSFGLNGISPFGIIVCKNSKTAFSTKSKYWAKTYIIKSYDEILFTLLNNFDNEAEKPVIITCCDTAGEVIDKNLDILKDKFILPSINMEQGKIIELMDKEKQVDFAKKNNLPMAYTRIARDNSWKFDIKDMPMPCIVKPVSSYEGVKSDIKKCTTKEELVSYLKIIFNEKGYKRILIQEFINFDYEIEFIGSYNKSDKSYLLSRTYRGWPVVGGTNSFFGILNDKNLEIAVADILNTFEKINFSGCFDIELFNVNGKIYLNEINWRNTGNSFFSLGTGVHYAVIWYYAVIGYQDDRIKHFCTDATKFAMNEATDFRHVFFAHYPFKKWNIDRKNTTSFALWFKGDMKPVYKRYFQLLKTLIFKK